MIKSEITSEGLYCPALDILVKGKSLSSKMCREILKRLPEVDTQLEVYRDGILAYTTESIKVWATKDLFETQDGIKVFKYKDKAELYV